MLLENHSTPNVSDVAAMAAQRSPVRA